MIKTVRAGRGGQCKRQCHPLTLVDPHVPLGSYTPQSICAHRRALRSGSLFCCMVCHRSGIDGHPALKRDPRTDPSPEPKPAPAPAKTGRETRKQRRQRLFAAQSPITNTIDA